MLILVGLGNPGTQYDGNRHNVGFMAVDAIADLYNFAEPKNKFKGILREGYLEREGKRCKILVLKPQTFMNESGKSVGELLRFYKIAPEQILVFHDELDIAPYKLRIKQGGGHAGHNGLRSIDSHIGNNFFKARLGIGHPGSKAAVHSYVLSDFAKAEQQELQNWLEAIAKSAPHLANYENKGFPRFQSEVANILNPNQHTDKKEKPGHPIKRPLSQNKIQSKETCTENNGAKASNPFAEALNKMHPPKS